MPTPQIDQEGAAASLWHVVQEFPPLTPLEGDTRCDVLVIGAGSGGLLSAYLLAKEGRDVLVVDAAPTVAGGESGRTTGHLNTYPDDGLSTFAKTHGDEGLRLFHESHTAAVDLIEQIIRDEGIDCDFERCEEYLFVAPEGKGDAYLDEELLAAHRIGWKDVRFVERAPMAVDTHACLLLPNQAHYDAGRFFSGLATVLERRGVRLRRARVGDDLTGDHAQTDRGRITFQHVVTATNTPINPPVADLALIHARQAPYRTYVVAFDVEPGAIPHAQWSDTLDTYHYVRVQRLAEGRDALIVGGEDHKTAHHNDGAERLERLERWARERWPAAGRVLARWSGQCMEPHDGAAFLGKNPGDDEGVTIITGDSGQGLTHTAIGALIARDRVLGRANPWATFYKPTREPMALGSTGTLLKENVDVTLQYREYLTGGDVKSRDDVRPGCGAILREGLKKLAVYRADDGSLHEHSAVCPHMGCIVAWNALEKSFDCPCHGGRYAPVDGQVLNGPATRGLAEA